MVDFSVLETPNYLNLYQTSFANGKKMERDKRVQNALKESAADLVGAQKELISLGAFDEAHQLQEIRRDQARQKAAKALSGGDYKGAAAAAADAGDAEQTASYAQQGRAADLGSQVAGGDIAGAQTSAMRNGDFDQAAAIAKLDDRQKAIAAEHSDTIAAIAQKLRADVPYAQRKRAIQSLAPALLERGFTQQQIDGFLNADPSDANLDAAIGSAMSLKEALAASAPKTASVADGSDLIDPTTGRVIYRNEKNFAPRAASSGAAASNGLPPGYQPVK